MVAELVAGRVVLVGVRVLHLRRSEYHGVRRACSRDHLRLSVLRVRPLCLGFATVPRVACAAPLIGEPDVGNQFRPVRIIRHCTHGLDLRMHFVGGDAVVETRMTMATTTQAHGVVLVSADLARNVVETPRQLRTVVGLDECC